MNKPDLPLLHTEAVSLLETSMGAHFRQLRETQDSLRASLLAHADGKTLKGNELVGWLGEIYIKILFSGVLVDDRHEHDVETPQGLRISVKARRGTTGGWRQSSAIPKTEGDACPTHLAFVQLNEDYTLRRVWLYDWAQLHAANRFKPHIVRGEQRSYIFHVRERADAACLIYSNTGR